MGFAALYPSYKSRIPVGWVEQRETHQYTDLMEKLTCLTSKGRRC
jgi:hypothetical protein